MADDVPSGHETTCRNHAAQTGISNVSFWSELSSVSKGN